MTPELLAVRFGPRSAVAQSTISALYGTQGTITLAGEAGDLSAAQITRLASLPSFNSLAGKGVSSVDISRLVAAIQLYYLGLTVYLENQLRRSLRCETLSPFSTRISPWEGLFSACREAVGSLLNEATPRDQPAEDLLKPLHHQLFPRVLRHALGEYYTPDWLAMHLLNVMGCDGRREMRILDPACGSGTFLLQVLARVRQQGIAERCSSREIAERIIAQVHGIDLNPLAVSAARVNYLYAIRDLLANCTKITELPLIHGDSILLTEAETQHSLQPHIGEFDAIIGNPPWIGWEHLSADYRQATLPHWQEQGLFPHGGMNVILGSGKKDLSLLMSYVVSDRLLKPGGRLGFVITQAAFKSSSAGAGFRRFASARAKVPFAIERVDDFSAWQTFPGATTRAVTFIWQKGRSTHYPVPYHHWSKPAGLSVNQESPASFLEQLTTAEKQAEPMQTDDPTSPWRTADAEAQRAVEFWSGPTPYRAHEGVNSGGANGVFWLEILETRGSRTLVRNITAGAKRQVPQIVAEVERELLFPLLRGKDVRRWQAVPSAYLLMTQDPERRRGVELVRMEAEFPFALKYLRQFETMLRERAAYRRYFTSRSAERTRQERAPFYSLFDVGKYTLAPCKVVWHRMISPLQAAVVTASNGKPILPQETHAFVPCNDEREAYYLAAVLNSRLFNLAAESYSPAGSKGFASPHLLEHLRIPQFDSSREEHRTLAELGGICSQATSSAERDSAIAAIETLIEGMIAS